MWLMTRHGFYSIVEKAPGVFQVRARERQDLQNLLDRVPLPDATIVDTPEADYACRLMVPQETLLVILAFLGNSLDYDNFKAAIDRTPDQARKPYHAIWELLADALGAYGSRGR